jgi:hypothetical protein
MQHNRRELLVASARLTAIGAIASILPAFTNFDAETWLAQWEANDGAIHVIDKRSVSFAFDDTRSAIMEERLLRQANDGNNLAAIRAFIIERRPDLLMETVTTWKAAGRA